jgi:hypothetical protein
MVENGKSRLDFRELENKPVYTSDRVLLGRIYSINYDHIVVKKGENEETSYRFPIGVFKMWDGYSLWLNVTVAESMQHIAALNNQIDDYPKPTHETVTFRLNENIMRSIRSEADNRTVSVNSFANYILKRFLEVDKFESMTGMSYINKPVLIEIFNKKTDKEIANLAKFTAKNAIYNTVLFSQGKKGIDAFLLWMEKEMNKHSFSVRHMTGKNKRTYIIRHEMGYKFSLYYKTIIEEIFSDHLKKYVDFTMSDEILLFEFDQGK